jgi:hypothetical protein
VTRTDQRAEALERAFYVKRQRAALRASLRGDDPSVARHVIQHPSREFATMRLFDLLATLPRLAERELRRVCRAADVDSSTRLDALTQRQRDTLCAELARRGL